MTTFLINLTGDYVVTDDVDNVAESELHQIDAFLGALRSTVNSKPDVFLNAISKAAQSLKNADGRKLALQIDSVITGNVLTHTFTLTHPDPG